MNQIKTLSIPIMYVLNFKIEHDLYVAFMRRGKTREKKKKKKMMKKKRM